ncbi:hypothetical protein AMELA_G00298200 [Ameiurus melas]|uniref:Pericentriolar material 1 protein n=1 Tax=Ameiurus melas TaxID=219545 RepID=A0A7J5ZKR3_AMEME|nr:hypothetical protein AMELA_G00298200 [Ameiurus melas]
MGAEEQELHNWTISNGSLDDQLNNMQKRRTGRQRRTGRSSLPCPSRLTNDISRVDARARARSGENARSFPPSSAATQMSVPDQASSTDCGSASTSPTWTEELFAPVPVAPVKEHVRGEENLRTPSGGRGGETAIDSSQVVSKLVQIREYISRASSMRDDLLEKNDVPANVERLSHLITHLKEQEKSYLRFLQKMLARESEEEEEDEGATVDSAVCSGSMAESASLNLEPRSEAADPTCYRVGGQQKEELENLRKQHELLQKMLQQQEELRELQNRQAALLTMQNRAEHAMDDTVVTETTESVSGVSITSELNDELNDLIRRFHNQLHDSQS